MCVQPIPNEEVLTERNFNGGNAKNCMYWKRELNKNRLILINGRENTENISYFLDTAHYKSMLSFTFLAFQFPWKMSPFISFMGYSLWKCRSHWELSVPNEKQRIKGQHEQQEVVAVHKQHDDWTGMHHFQYLCNWMTNKFE